LIDADAAIEYIKAKMIPNPREGSRGIVYNAGYEFAIRAIEVQPTMVLPWAAEHKEPVYPSWYEYLTDMYPAAWDMIKDKPIPADIAQKLGVKPEDMD
jgi:hypothetical protein